MTDNLIHAAPAARVQPAAKIAGLCAAALFLLPFVWLQHTRPLVTFYSEWIAAAILIAACLFPALGAARSGRPAFELPAVAPLFLPLTAVILLQWGLGRLTYTSDAVLPLLSLALATAAFVLGHLLARRIGLARLLVWIGIAAVIGALFNIALQILQLCTHSGVAPAHMRFDSNGQYFGAVAQRNHLSTYLSWALVGVLYLHAVRRIHAVLSLPLVLVLLVGMALTLSRTGWLQVLWIAFAGTLWMRALEPHEQPRHWRWLLGLPVVFAIVNLALPALLDTVGLVFTGSALERAATEGMDGNRRLLYLQGLQLFFAHPFLGVGPGQLIRHQFLLLDQAEQTLFAGSTHNLLLDLLVTTGLLGTLPFLLIAGLWLMRLTKQRISVERAAILLMLGALAIHAMLELPHWYAFFLLPAALLAGALDPGSLRLPSGNLLRLLPAVLCLYAATVAASMLGQYRQLESMHARYYSKERSHAVVDEKRLAEILAFRRTTWFTGPAEFILCTNIALNEIALKDKLDIAARTVRVLPEPHVVYRYVLLLALDGRQEEGLVLLARLRKMFPEAYREIAAEFVQLSERQPAVFGRLGEVLKPTL